MLMHPGHGWVSESLVCGAKVDVTQNIQIFFISSQFEDPHQKYKVNKVTFTMISISEVLNLTFKVLGWFP